MSPIKLLLRTKVLIAFLFILGLFMQSCQTQQLYHPYFVYQGQLNNASCPDETDEAIRMIASKHTSAIFFRDFFRYYYRGQAVSNVTFCNMYTKQVGAPCDYTIEIWYNLFEIPIFKVMRWTPNRFNIYELDILTR